MSDPANVYEHLTPDLPVGLMLGACYCIHRTSDATVWPLPMDRTDQFRAENDLRFRLGIDPSMTVAELQRRLASEPPDRTPLSPLPAGNPPDALAPPESLDGDTGADLRERLDEAEEKIAYLTAGCMKLGLVDLVQKITEIGSARWKAGRWLDAQMEPLRSTISHQAQQIAYFETQKEALEEAVACWQAHAEELACTPAERELVERARMIHWLTTLARSASYPLEMAFRVESCAVEVLAIADKVLAERAGS
jgi:hypothetical protein